MKNDVHLAVEILMNESSGETKSDGGGGIGGSGGSGAKSLEVTLPEGLEPGMELIVQDPETLKQHTIVVPKKYTPGEKVRIEVKD